jgi:hypothetical protein
VLCEYLHIEQESLRTLLEVARRKLNNAVDAKDA